MIARKSPVSTHPVERSHLADRLPVTISVPCQNDTFTFTDTSGAASPLSVSWTCSQPTGTASLGSCSYSAGSGWSCPLTIAASGNNQVDWPWSASSSGVSGINISPPNGSLPPGQSTTATATIPDMVCPASATITVSGGASNIPLNWSCPAPTLQVDNQYTHLPRRFAKWLDMHGYYIAGFGLPGAASVVYVGIEQFTRSEFQPSRRNIVSRPTNADKYLYSGE